MKKIAIGLVAGLALVAASGSAFAQLGGLIGGLKGGGSSVSPDQIVNEYVAGSQSVLTANSFMLEAVGQKDEAAKAALEAKNLTQGATSDSLSEAERVQTESSKSLEDALNGKKITMDEASKKKFSQGMVNLAQGVVLYVKMAVDVKGFKPGITSIGASATGAIYVVKTLPESTQNVATTMKAAIAFSKANDIPVPKEASDATAML
ncbi:MAG TPA: hypothetical protein VNW52_13200 [Burkholderiaceae bacterium]|jgi:hypothetical protein|nr:hypothetical protein [Burkholderiaceae bacterium]